MRKSTTQIIHNGELLTQYQCKVAVLDEYTYSLEGGLQRNALVI